MGDQVHILREDPELGEHLQGNRLDRARQSCVATTISLPAGVWTPTQERDDPRLGLGLLVLDGLIIRRIGLADRFGAELLGEGELLRPWQGHLSMIGAAQQVRWRVLQPTRLAVLDHEFMSCVSNYPEVTSMLVARVTRRSRQIAVNMAIVQQPRIDLRLQLLFWELADRWGTVHHDGVHVRLHLTHATLAELVAARRQTVTKALGELAQQRALVWTGHHWLLAGEAPAEQELVAVAGSGTARR